MFAALKAPPGWPTASLVLAKPTVWNDRYELFPVGVHDSETSVSAEAVTGRREALCIVRIGSKDEMKMTD